MKTLQTLNIHNPKQVREVDEFLAEQLRDVQDTELTHFEQLERIRQRRLEQDRSEQECATGIRQQGVYLAWVRQDVHVNPGMSRDESTNSRALRLLMPLPGLLSSPKDRPLHELTERELIQRESEIGRTLFGDIAPHQRREFFNTSPEVWIWHEEWRDEDGTDQQLTTKYDIREDGVYKVQPGPRYTKISGDELSNFYRATSSYFSKVMQQVYRRDPTTGEALGRPARQDEYRLAA